MTIKLINENTGESIFNDFHIYPSLYDNYVNYLDKLTENELIELIIYCSSYLFDGELIKDIDAKMEYLKQQYEDMKVWALWNS